jgi:hypothetical protein
MTSFIAIPVLNRWVHNEIYIVFQIYSISSLYIAVKSTQINEVSLHLENILAFLQNAQFLRSISFAGNYHLSLWNSDFALLKFTPPPPQFMHHLFDPDQMPTRIL